MGSNGQKGLFLEIDSRSVRIAATARVSSEFDETFRASPLLNSKLASTKPRPWSHRIEWCSGRDLRRGMPRFRIRGSFTDDLPRSTARVASVDFQTDKAAMLSASALTGLHHRSTSRKRATGSLSYLLHRDRPSGQSNLTLQRRVCLSCANHLARRQFA